MIETDSTFISKLDDDTIKVIFKTDAYLTVEEYDSLYEHYKEVLGREDNMKFLAIIQPGFKMEKQYSKFFRQNYKSSFKGAEAYVILHPPARVFFKVGLKLIKYNHPIKMFNKEEDALSWLKSIKHKH